MKNKVTNIVCAGVLAILLTGCAKETAVVANMESIATGADEVQVIDSKNTSDVEEKKSLGLKEGTSTFVDGKETEQQDLIDAAVNDLKNYLGLTIDLSKCVASVSYFKEQDGIEAYYFVSLSTPENMEILSDEKNIGLDGYPTKEAKKKLKPEYYASYDCNKKLMGLSVLNIKWEESLVPLTIGECKKIAEEFLTSNKMVADGKIELLKSEVVTDSRVYFIYKNGADEAIGLSVNTYASMIENFEYMDKEQTKQITDPSKGVKGVG